MSRRVLVILSLCLLLLSSCTSASNASTQATPTAAQPGNNLPSPTTQSLSSLQQTEQLLLMTPPQASDPVDLTRRLKTHAATAPARVSRTTPLNGQAGQEDTFWIENQDTETYSQIRARLVTVTAHAYLYVQDGQ